MLAVAALLALAASAPAAALPRGFLGVVPQGPLAERDWARMQGVVETVRSTFDWGQIEPAPGVWDFAGTDAVVRQAARSGIRVMPLLYGVPDWIAGDSARPPSGERQRARWARFVRRVVDRYGPAGDHWSQRPADLAIRRWQVWNEPNFKLFWQPRPEPRRYVGLLKLTARAIRSRDPGATIVAAGVAPVRGGMSPRDFLREMYSVPGASRAFDFAALHPYSFTIAQLRYQVEEFRAVMGAAGDGAKPLLVSEIGVASAAALPTPFDLGPRGQARFLRLGLGLLVSERRRWRIAGVDWFSWRDGARDDPYCAFCQHSGLIGRRGKPKPAWHSFRRLVLRERQSGLDRVR